jgi:hypothetical protein
MKTDAKIDMLHQSGLFGNGTTNARTSVSDISEDVEEGQSVSVVSLSSFDRQTFNICII